MKYLFTCRSHFTMAGLPFSWSSRHLRPLASTRTLTRQAFGQRSLSSLLCKFLASCMPSVCHYSFSSHPAFSWKAQQQLIPSPLRKEIFLAPLPWPGTFGQSLLTKRQTPLFTGLHSALLSSHSSGFSNPHGVSQRGEGSLCLMKRGPHLSIEQICI